MPAPSYCTISGICYQESPTATSGTPILAPKGRLHVTPVSVTDNIIWEHTQTVQADPTTALITFNAVQGSTIHIQGSVMGWVAGDNVLVPSSSTSTLEALTSVATVPVSGLTIQEEGVPLAGLFGTVNFIGGGVTAVRVSAGVASVTVSATGTYQPLDDDLTAIAALGTALQQLRVNAGATALEYFTPTSSGVALGDSPTWTGSHIFSKNGALSLPTASLTGSWITGGSATTNKPHVLIEPTGATSAAWSTAGTGLGINAATGFTGNLLDLQLNGVMSFRVTAAGAVTLATNQQLAIPGAGTLSIGSGGAQARLTQNGEGILTLTDSTQVAFNRITLGGTTSSFGAVARDGAGLRVVTANSATAYSFLGVSQLRVGAATVIWTSGTGSPESVVTAGIGSLYTRTDGGAATTLYVKESGAGNTGWIAK